MANAGLAAALAPPAPAFWAGLQATMNAVPGTDIVYVVSFNCRSGANNWHTAYTCGSSFTWSAVGSACSVLFGVNGAVFYYLVISPGGSFTVTWHLGALPRHE